MQFNLNYYLSDRSTEIVDSIWIGDNSTDSIGRVDIPTYPLGYPFIYIAAKNSYGTGFKGNDSSFQPILAAQIDRPKTFSFTLNSGGILIRLKPWTLYNLTGKSATCLTNGCWGLSIINGYLSNSLWKVLNQSQSLEYKVWETEKILLHSLKDHTIEPRLVNAIAYVKAKFGIVKIEELAAHVCLSTRRLQQLFAQHIGLSPKKIASIYRLHKIIHDMFLNESPYCSHQYHFDQAHFINDFKKLTGMSFGNFKKSMHTTQSIKTISKLNLY